MSDDITVKLSVEAFKEQEPPEQMSLIYQAVSATQSRVEILDGRIDKLETNRKLQKAKVAGIAIGSGAGGGTFMLWLKSLLGP